MKNIQLVSDSYLCSNCGACSAICTKNAIDFKWSKIGRLYADVNDKCIDCGLCQKVCPSIDVHNIHEIYEDKYVGVIKKVYVGKTTDEQYYKNAQSGGIVTSILALLFDQGSIDAAIVCKMEYAKTPKVTPIIIENKEQLFSTQKSCYTPVALLSVLKQSVKFKSVAIVGLPCHIQGVVELQKTVSKYNNINYKIGLICDRTECAGIHDVIKDFTGFDSFIIHWRQKFNEDTNVYNYKSAPLVALSSNGEKKELPRHYRTALKEMFTPPRCRVCWDKINVFSDITLGDPWRIKNTDMVSGESLIIVRTDIGENIVSMMQKANRVMLKEHDIKVALQSQLIKSRQMQVDNFSRAFEVLGPQVDSYLINNSAKEHNKERTILRNFVSLEKENKCKMIEIAHNQIEQYETDCKKKNTTRKKIIGIIKRIIRKTI